MCVSRSATTPNTVPTRAASRVPNSRLVSLNEADAARYIGMSAAWLKKSRTRAHRNRSDAPPFVRVGTRVVYRLVDLDAWQLAHLVDGMTPNPVQLVQNPADDPAPSVDRSAMSRVQLDAPAPAASASRGNGGPSKAGHEPAFERHYRISELAELWNLGRETLRMLVKDEDGVIKVRLGGRKAHTIYSVPESVAKRIHTRLQNRR
jgi:hypothetical protein